MRIVVVDSPDYDPFGVSDLVLPATGDGRDLGVSWLRCYPERDPQCLFPNGEAFYGC
jgi:hypothetical protein